MKKRCEILALVACGILLGCGGQPDADGALAGSPARAPDGALDAAPAEGPTGGPAGSPSDARDEAPGTAPTETRLLVQHEDGWVGYPYRWNDEAPRPCSC
ncbi:MAG: hypothetical protein OXT09_29025 [Myxococcales bacterium]|nr:hypothetical protein [Myxococcales bacterium]